MKSIAPWFFISALSSSLVYATEGIDAYRQGKYGKASLLLQESEKDPVAAFYAGRMRLYGYGQLKNNAQALQYFITSGEKGYLPAQQLLARYYLLVDPQPEKAYYWFKKAADASTLSAQMYCAAANLYGFGTRKNPEAAKKFYIEAAKKGNAIAQYTLGADFLASGNTSNKKLGVIWLTKAAQQGNAQAQAMLGELYLSGKLLAKDTEKAQELLLQSAKQKYVPAMLQLASWEEAKENYSLAREWLLQASQTKDDRARVALGLFLLNEKTPFYNKETGFLEILQVAQNGFTKAQSLLASLYKAGKVVTANENIAKQWQEKAEDARVDTTDAGTQVSLWLSNNTSPDFAIADYRLGGILRDWQNHEALQEHRYNLSPKMGTFTKKDLFQPVFSMVEPKSIPISDYFDVLASNINQGSNTEWTYPRYPIDSQMENLLRKNSLVLRHSRGVSVIDDGATFLDEPKEAPWSYIQENTQEGQHKAHIQAYLSQLHNQAVLGESAAQFEIGQLYQYGIGIHKDIHQAVIYYQLAAAQQDVRAEYNLAVLYLEGKVTPLNYQKGIAWMTDAAFKGNAYAQYVLANLYANGLKDGTGKLVIAPNKAQALSMFYLASANNFALAQYKLADALVKENNQKLSTVTKHNRSELIKRLYTQAYKKGISEAVIPLAFYNAMDSDPLKQQQAFKIAKREAKAGNMEAALLLGMMYERGISVPVSQQKALAWYQKTSQNKVSDFILGTYYGQGIGVEKNEGKARKMLERSAEAGFSFGSLNLAIYKQQSGEYFLDDLETARSAGNGKAGLLLADYYISLEKEPTFMEKARAIYQHFSEKGDRDAQVKLGFLYEQGLSVRPNFALAREWYTKASMQRQPVAQYLLGQMYQFGKENPQGIPDYAAAKKWYKEAENYSKAMVALGFVYDTVEDDYQNAYQQYQKAANINDPVGLYNLGLLYQEGKGRAMDMQKAETLFVKAKDAGFVPAMTALAKLYLQSSSNTSKEEAVQWYKKAASLGDREAMYYLGLLQETGVGMHLNKQDALQNYQLAAERGHEKAILALARMYRYGLGVNKDLSLAAKYYKQLAKNNNGYAQYQLALLYADGSILIEKPEERAKALLMAASRNGSREAQERLTWSNAKQEKNKSFIAAIPMKRSATNKPSSAERMYLEVVNGWNHGDEASSKSMLEALRTHYPDFIPAKEAYERMEQHAKAQML